MFFEGNITDSQVIPVPDTREEIKVYTDTDVTVSFFSFKLNDWGPEIDVIAPGDFVVTCGNQMRVTGTARVVVC